MRLSLRGGCAANALWGGGGGGSDHGREEWKWRRRADNSGYSVKREPMRLTAGLDVECRESRGLRVTPRRSKARLL